MESPLFRSKFFWGVADPVAFGAGIDSLVAAARVKRGWFAADNLIAFGRNLGFLTDEPFIEAWKVHAQTPEERGVLWRTATVVWAARQAMRRGGDLVECGCYKGTTARILMDSVDLSERRYFLYDLFEHDASMNHHAMPEHGAELFETVKARFADFANVSVIKGAVPESFSQGLPDQIAFAHIDMNNAAAEIGALDAIEDRLVPGAMIVLDDFGALPYRKQHVAETEWFGKRGIPVLELPTSQGLAIW
ncbi:class I SAM-dependent methyltransferase [Phenylobacterium sp.]|uniref:class I SAM-dependent methyltransferase n=1 Tax=Phenylobacterium sp. TaxID=1871053 RepID=UPI0012042353|nr:class I SAM-dependent methyltransferase [Phenylobacterium sp.]THD60954.1 MAG: class I SAM-dependent methyltransferase [Phenylobacterium sp.]